MWLTGLHKREQDTSSGELDGNATSQNTRSVKKHGDHVTCPHELPNLPKGASLPTPKPRLMEPRSRE